MSRSWKKFPVVRQERVDKKSLNKRLRRNDKLAKIPNGSTYKKYAREWDWHYVWTKEQAMRDYEAKPWIKEQYSLSQWLNYWANLTMRK